MERREQCLMHEEKINRMEKKIDDIHKIICGNGKLGLAGQVQIIWIVLCFFMLRMGYLVWETLIQ